MSDLRKIPVMTIPPIGMIPDGAGALFAPLS
jgi:hypothetical protein